MVWYGTVWCMRYGAVWSCVVWYGLMWWGVWYGVVLCCVVVWYVCWVVWYGVVWCGGVMCCERQVLHASKRYPEALAMLQKVSASRVARRASAEGKGAEPACERCTSALHACA